MPNPTTLTQNFTTTHAIQQNLSKIQSITKTWWQHPMDRYGQTQILKKQFRWLNIPHLPHHSKNPVSPTIFCCSIYQRLWNTHTRFKVHELKHFILNVTCFSFRGSVGTIKLEWYAVITMQSSIDNASVGSQKAATSRRRCWSEPGCEQGVHLTVKLVWGSSIQRSKSQVDDSIGLASYHATQPAKASYCFRKAASKTCSIVHTSTQLRVLIVYVDRVRNCRSVDPKHELQKCLFYFILFCFLLMMRLLSCVPSFQPEAHLLE